MKILVDKDGTRYKVDESNILPQAKRARILKSFRTVEGADTYLDVMKYKIKDAIVIKSLEGYNEYCDASGLVVSSPPVAPVHVIVEEDLEDVVEIISVKNPENMFKTMYKEGLLNIEHSGIFLSPKFFELLNKYTEEALVDYMNFEDPQLEKAEDGTPMVDIVSSAYKIMKSSKLGLTQEEASNKDAPERTESLGDGVGEASEEIDKTETGTDSKPDEQGVTQEEASNKDAPARTRNVTDDEIDDKFGDVKNVDDVHVFKSLSEANGFLRRNNAYTVTSTSLADKSKYGKKYTFIAKPRPRLI